MGFVHKKKKEKKKKVLYKSVLLELSHVTCSDLICVCGSPTQGWSHTLMELVQLMRKFHKIFFYQSKKFNNYGNY